MTSTPTSRKAAPMSGHVVLKQRTTIMVAVEMTGPQRDAYAKHYGNEFVGEEIGNRLTFEVVTALRGDEQAAEWLRWLRENATVTISKAEV